MRNSLLLGGASSLGAQGFLDTAQDVITKHQAAADNDPRSSALQLRLRIEQVKPPCHLALMSMMIELDLEGTSNRKSYDVHR